MAIGIITGSGTYSLPGFEGSGPEPVATDWGEALVSRGTFAGAEVLHVSRHGAGHARLSNLVTHRANIAALKALGAKGVIAVTVCGAVDPSLALGSLVCFDDLYFLGNRLGDGELCTFYSSPGDPRRGHWIYEDPFSAGLRAALLAGCAEAGVAVRDGGVLRARRRAAVQHEGGDPRRSPRAGWSPCRRRRGRRPCCAARRSCRTRCSATRPTTPTACRTSRRRCRRCST